MFATHFKRFRNDDRDQGRRETTLIGGGGGGFIDIARICYFYKIARILLDALTTTNAATCDRIVP